MGCYYGDDMIQKYDGIANPIGKACYTCDELGCEHNENTEEDDYGEELYTPQTKG